MAELATQLPGRYNVRAGVVNGEMVTEVTDRLANAGLRFSLLDALQVAGLMVRACHATLAVQVAEAEREMAGPMIEVAR